MRLGTNQRLQSGAHNILALLKLSEADRNGMLNREAEASSQVSGLHIDPSELVGSWNCRVDTPIRNEE
jgi:hypothetical protein